MSDLAKMLAEIDTSGERIRRGPQNSCLPLYGEGDLDAWEQIESLRAKGLSWLSVQQQVDAILGISHPIPPTKFIYHWRRRCFCWSEADRL